MKTMHLSPKDVLVGIEVHLEDGLDTDKIEVITDQIERDNENNSRAKKNSSI